jgi:hypothetical protein
MWGIPLWIISKVCRILIIRDRVLLIDILNTKYYRLDVFRYHFYSSIIDCLAMFKLNLTIIKYFNDLKKYSKKILIIKQLNEFR